MPISTLVPLFGGPPWAAGGHHPPFVLFPFFGALMFVLFLLLVLGALFLARRGRLGPPPWIAARMHSPELSPDVTARRILAERFAKGELDSDDFLERASVLNWTPGSEQFPPPTDQKKSKR